MAALELLLLRLLPLLLQLLLCPVTLPPLLDAEPLASMHGNPQHYFGHVIPAHMLLLSLLSPTLLLLLLLAAAAAAVTYRGAENELHDGGVG